MEVTVAADVFNIHLLDLRFQYSSDRLALKAVVDIVDGKFQLATVDWLCISKQHQEKAFLVLHFESQDSTAPNLLIVGCPHIY